MHRDMEKDFNKVRGGVFMKKKKKIIIFSIIIIVLILFLLTRCGNSGNQAQFMMLNVKTEEMVKETLVTKAC